MRFPSVGILSEFLRSLGQNLLIPDEVPTTGRTQDLTFQTTPTYGEFVAQNRHYRTRGSPPTQELAPGRIGPYNMQSHRQHRYVLLTPDRHRARTVRAHRLSLLDRGNSSVRT